MNKKYSINFKVAIVIFLALILQSILLLVLNYLDIKEEVLQDIENQERVSAYSLQSILNHHAVENDLQNMQQSVTSLGADTRLQVAVLINEEQNIIASTNLKYVNTHLESVFDTAEYHETLSKIFTSARTQKTQMWKSSRYHALYVSVPVLLGRSEPGVLRLDRVGVLFKKIDLKSTEQRVKNILIEKMLPVIISLLVVTSLIYFFIQYFVTGKILKLKNSAENFSLDREFKPVKIMSNDEIGSLSDSFNRVYQRIIDQHQQLVKNQNLLQASQKIAKLGSWEFDVENNKLFWSDEVYRIFGVNKDEQEISLEFFSGCIYPDDREKVLEAYSKSLEAGEDKYKIEHRIIKRDSAEIRYVVEECIHVRDIDEKVIRSIGMVHDITNEYLATQRIVKQQKETQLILDSMTDAVITINQYGHIITFNKAAVELFGYHENEILGQNVSVLMPDKIANHHDDYVNNYLITGEKKLVDNSRDVEAVNKYGERIDIRLAISELEKDESGNKRFIGVIHDITEEKLQDEQLRQSQKMEALGKLTGGVAHDFNNMLGVILGYGDLLVIKSEEGSEYYEYGMQIINAGERARKLTSRLLAFSRHNVRNEELVDINALLKNSEDMITKSMTPKINVHFELADVDCLINVDTAALEDAVLNMSINSMHAMPTGGELTFTTTVESITGGKRLVYVDGPGEYVVLTVKDTGTGMDEETRGKMFDPFFTTKGESGTGLGLSQVYRFVKTYKGGIAVETKLGVGTEIEIFFPCADKDNNVAGQKQLNDDAVVTGDESILVVDDEAGLCQLIETQLQLCGFKVDTADNGEAGLKRFKENSYDLLITDVIMPGMDGYQLVERVTEMNPGIKILMVSGYDDKEAAKKFTPGPNIQRLKKPFKIKELQSKVRLLLDD